MRTKVLTLTITIGLALTAFILTSCTSSSGNGSVDLSKNENLQENIYHQILNDSTLFYNFMNTMIADPRAMTRMMNNPAMMQYMFSDNNLQYIMQHHAGMNGYMIHNMMNVAAGDSVLASQWNSMIIQQHQEMMMNH